jgi:hypothetical protein
MQKNEKALFQLIADEMEKGSIDKGIWARALSEADGVDSQTRARYIRYRMEELLALKDEPRQTSVLPQEQTKLMPSVASDDSRQTEEQKSPVFDSKTLSNDVLYRAAVGDFNSEYYVEKFERFDEQRSGYTLNWNWPAFLFSVPWALYRKMYGWFFALLGIFVFAGILEKNGATLAAGLIFWVVSITFGVYANSIYYNRILGKISAFRATTSDDKKFISQLRDEGGVHLWAKYVAIAFWAFSLVVIFFVAIQGKNNSSSKAELVKPSANAPAQNSIDTGPNRNWSLNVADQDGTKHYVDMNSIKRDGHIITADYLWDQSVKDADGTASIIASVRWNCQDRIATYLIVNEYAQKMGGGGLISTTYPRDKFPISDGRV